MLKQNIHLIQLAIIYLRAMEEFISIIFYYISMPFFFV